MSQASRFEDARVLLETVFVAGFIASPGVPFVPVRFQNVNFAQPTDATWAEFWIMEGQGGNASVGGDLQRTPGFVLLKIFSPENGGTKRARQCSDKLNEIFQNRTDIMDTWGEFTFRAGCFNTIGKTQTGWFQHNAIVDFWLDVRPMP